jgi:hypothetical protein
MQYLARFIGRGILGLVAIAALTLLALGPGKADIISVDICTLGGGCPSGGGPGSINVFGTNGGTLLFDLESPATNEPFVLVGSVDFTTTSNNPGLGGTLSDVTLLATPQQPGPHDYGDTTQPARPAVFDSMYDSTLWSVTVAASDLAGSPISVLINTSGLDCTGNATCLDPQLTIISTGDLTFTPQNAGVPGPIAGAGLPGLLFAGSGFLAWLRRKRRGSTLAMA